MPLGCDQKAMEKAKGKPWKMGKDLNKMKLERKVTISHWVGWKDGWSTCQNKCVRVIVLGISVALKNTEMIINLSTI